MEFGKIYSAVDADEVKVGTYGYFSDYIASIRERMKSHDISTLHQLQKVEGTDCKDRFVFKSDISDVHYAMCAPVCSERNLNAYKAWCAGIPITYNGSTFSKGDGRLCDFLNWDIDLDVKKYVPFKDIGDLITASGVELPYAEHGAYPFIWLKDKIHGTAHLVSGYNYQQQKVCLGIRLLSMEQLLEEFTFDDGTPCGKISLYDEEEEK